MASARVVGASVAGGGPSRGSTHPDDLFQSRYVTPGLKPFSYYFKVLLENAKIIKVLMKYNII